MTTKQKLSALCHAHIAYHRALIEGDTCMIAACWFIMEDMAQTLRIGYYAE